MLQNVILVEKTFSSFTIIATFIALTIIALALTPLLNQWLHPGRNKPGVTVSYQMRGVNAVVIDREVTFRQEGLFSRIVGLKKLTSDISRQRLDCAGDGRAIG